VKRRPFGRSSQCGEAVGPWGGSSSLYYEWTVCLRWRPSPSCVVETSPIDHPWTTQTALRLPRYRDPRNLVRFRHLPHTPLTYHRTWETGLETEIRVAAFSPAFFCPHRGDSGVSKPTLNMVSVTPATVHPPDFSGFPLCSSVPPVVQALLFDRNLRCGRKRHKPPRFAGLGST
jgi:hypothetical protein